MNEIRIVDNSYAVIQGASTVIGVVEHYSLYGWRFVPLVAGDGDTTSPVPLSCALMQGVKFEVMKP